MLAREWRRASLAKQGRILLPWRRTMRRLGLIPSREKERREGMNTSMNYD